MAINRIVTVLCVLMPLTQATTVPVDQTLMFKEIDSLLKRCPCVPINTCYSQGVSLNEQAYLNLHFQCSDHTYNHCCGPYYPTLGSEDFYFDDRSALQNGPLSPATDTEDKTVPMPPSISTEMPETLTKVVIVYPETTTTSTTTTEAPAETTTDPSVDDASETTEMDPETTTEPITTTTPQPTTTEPTTTTTTTTAAAIAKNKLSTQAERTARLQNRPPYPKTDQQKVRSTKAPRRSSTTAPTTTTTTTTSTTVSPAARRFPTRKALKDSDFHRRFMMSRMRMQAKSSTTTTTERPRFRHRPRPSSMSDEDYDDDDYYDDDDDDDDDDSDED